MIKGANKLPGASSIKALILFMRAPKRAPSLNIITLGISISTYGFWEATHIQITADTFPVDWVAYYLSGSGWRCRHQGSFLKAAKMCWTLLMPASGNTKVLPSHGMVLPQFRPTDSGCTAWKWYELAPLLPDCWDTWLSSTCIVLHFILSLCIVFLLIVLQFLYKLIVYCSCLWLALQFQPPPPHPQYYYSF